MTNTPICDKYADLRVLTTARISLNDKKSAIENKITAVLDEYFPEFTTVFKHPYKGKAAVQILKSCPLPKDILELVNKQLEEIKERMGNILADLDIGKYLLSVNGLGVVTVAMLLGEIGDPLRFDDAKQISRLAGYNLIEDSSGKNKSGTAISKRGRKNLRRVLYQISLTMVATNSEMKKLYHYLKTRKENPLKKMQALVVIGKKVLSLIYAHVAVAYLPAIVKGKMNGCAALDNHRQICRRQTRRLKPPNSKRVGHKNS